MGGPVAEGEEKGEREVEGGQAEEEPTTTSPTKILAAKESSAAEAKGGSEAIGATRKKRAASASLAIPTPGTLRPGRRDALPFSSPKSDAGTWRRP